MTLPIPSEFVGAVILMATGSVVGAAGLALLVWAINRDYADNQFCSSWIPL